MILGFLFGIKFEIVSLQYNKQQMKSILNIIFGSVVLFSFAQCGNSKEMTYKLQEDTTFKVINGTYQSWVAGVRGGGSGITVVFQLDDFNASKMTMDSLYFRDQVLKIYQKKDNYVAHYRTKANQKPKLIMHSDSDAEYGNKAPEKKEVFPFKLANNEAVIMYKEGEKAKFLKIQLKEKQAEHYP